MDLASSGDTIWVTNGFYLTGGKVADGLILTNRVCIDKNLTLKSVNGPSVTYIFGTHNPLGAQAVRCMYVSGATKVVIDGFTFRNGGTHTTSPEDSGGGIYTKNHTIVTNCIFDECYADRYGGGIAEGSGSELLLWVYNTQIKECEADSGGGVYRASVVNCTLSKNYARDKHGGGMYYGDAYNCVFSNNFAKMYGGGGCSVDIYNSLVIDNESKVQGGGCEWGNVSGCTVINNTSPIGGGIWNCASCVNSIIWSNSSAGTAISLSYTCSRDVTEGVNGCTTNNPMFRDYAGGNFRLQRESPCINAGTNADVITTYGDLDGHSRVVGSRVDMGAYETLLTSIRLYCSFS